MITFGRPSDWDEILPAERGLSHRSTTSSRKPGRKNEGTVATVRTSQTICPFCGGARRDSPHPHAPRWIAIKGGHVQVDCAGRLVTPNRSTTT